MNTPRPPLHHVLPLLGLLCSPVLFPSSGCSCGSDDTNDAGFASSPEPGELDAGTGTPVVDAGRPSTDAGTLSLPEQASLLCHASVRGQAQQALENEATASRCSATDAVADILLDANAAPVDDTLCLPGREDYERFLEVISSGRVAFDIDAMARCVSQAQDVRQQNGTQGKAAQRAIGLATVLQSAACVNALHPLVVQGGECRYAWDCVEGLACQADPRDVQTFTCLPPAAIGESCDERQIDGRLPLRICVDSARCIAQVCTERLPLAAGCQGSGPDCSEGLVCGVGGFCLAPASEGENCLGDLECDSGLSCQNQLCTPFDAVTPLADGEPCSRTSECAQSCSVCRPSQPPAAPSNLQDAGPLLDAGHKEDGGANVDAGPPPSRTFCLDRGGVGEACDVDDHCRSGLFCGAGRCEALRGPTESCDGNTPCQEGLYCSDVGACVLLPALGGPCLLSGADRCAEGFCQASVCTAGLSDDPCNDDTTCASAHLCVANLCTPTPREGAPCTADRRCGPGTFCGDNDRCQGLPGPGTACLSGTCNDEAYCNVDVETPTCTLRRPTGSVCTQDAQCTSRLCLDSNTCGARQSAASFDRPTLTSLLTLSLLGPLWLVRKRQRAKSRKVPSK